jgi:hypothetical protein
MGLHRSFLLFVSSLWTFYTYTLLDTTTLQVTPADVDIMILVIFAPTHILSFLRMNFHVCGMGLVATLLQF